MTARGFGLVHTIRVFGACRVRLPTVTWFLSVTNDVHNQFWLVYATTVQYLNFCLSVISIFDGRRRSVNIDSTIENKMKIETSMTSQVGENSRPYFPFVHHRLVPGKHPQRHWHNSKLNSWYWQLGYIPDTGMVSGFFWIFLIFVPGTHFYRKQTKYTTLAASPVRTTTWKTRLVVQHDTVTGGKSGSYHGVVFFVCFLCKCVPGTKLKKNQKNRKPCRCPVCIHKLPTPGIQFRPVPVSLIAFFGHRTMMFTLEEGSTLFKFTNLRWDRSLSLDFHFIFSHGNKSRIDICTPLSPVKDGGWRDRKKPPPPGGCSAPPSWGVFYLLWSLIKRRV